MTYREGSIKVIQVFHHPTTYRNQSTIRATQEKILEKTRHLVRGNEAHFMKATIGLMKALFT